MNKLTKNKVFNIIFTLLFLGVLLSFSLFFLMTSILDGGDSDTELFNTTVSVTDSDLSSFDAACFKNSKVHDYVIRAEYSLFGNIRQGNVICGKNGFLFPVGANESGYNYLTDFMGGYTLTEEELEGFYRAISTRRRVYENQGRYYALAVIPNSQTVYSEHMPGYFTASAGETLLSRLSAYMKEKQESSFIDLTPVMLSEKKSGLLYNNTENSLNAQGAYYVYRGIMDGLSDKLDISGRIIPISEFTFNTHYTEGKALASAAGLHSLIKNQTVSISNSSEFKYTVVDHTEELETTYIKSHYRNDVPLNPYVLIECTNEWDKIQLTPYFSSTFGVSSYKVGHEYNKALLNQTNPLIVIQTVHEDELAYLLDKWITGQYDSALSEEATPYKTRQPMNVEYAILDGHSICITGIVENDATVQVFGDGFETVSCSPIEGRFFIRVELNGPAEGKEVFLNAQAPNKAASELTTLVISGINNIGSARDVAVGSNSMLYLTNYNVMMSLPSESERKAFEHRLYNLFYQYSLSNGDFSTKVIFAILPEKPSVYTEGAPEILSEQINLLKNVRSTMLYTLDKAGAVTVDLSERLRPLAGEKKLFSQTDETITDLGYYYMYSEIVNAMGMTPIGHDRFLEYSVPMTSGRLASALGFDTSKVSESVTRLRFSCDTKFAELSNGSRVAYSSDGKLPRAIVVYDRKSLPMLDLLSTHFSVSYFLPEGDTNISNAAIETIDPDYIIYLCDEGEIDFLLRQ